MKKRVTNIAASVHARLLNRAKAEKRPFNELLQYYVMERFLYRLSRSDHADLFVLKGALMLQFWGGPLTRATKDIDFLGRTTMKVDELVDVIKECVVVPVDDGLRFDPENVEGEEIRLAANYNGVRIRCSSQLGNALIKLQIDVGFGDVVTPHFQKVEYPTILAFEAPRLLGTTPETVVAEKFEAMVVLDMANTRMKDFLDMWILTQGREFSGPLLARAVEATFRRRRTPLPRAVPVALTPVFHSAPMKQTQWRAYIRKSRVQGTVPPFDEVVKHIESFVVPVIEALNAGSEFTRRWLPGGPWADGD